MKKKILMFSMAFLACSFSSAQAGESFGNTVDAFADLNSSSWAVTGASSYVGDFYFNQSTARTASVWDITTQPDAVPVFLYDTDITLMESVKSVDGNVLARATGETGIDLLGAKFIASQSNVQLMPGYSGPYSAEASALRGQAYEVTAAGGTTVTFSIEYMLNVLYDSDAVNNSGVAMAWIHLRQFDHALGEFGDWSDEILLEDFLIIDGPGYAKGTLSLSYDVGTINSLGT
jgi:hypothetical protein